MAVLIEVLANSTLPPMRFNAGHFRRSMNVKVHHGDENPSCSLSSSVNSISCAGHEFSRRDLELFDGRTLEYGSRVDGEVVRVCSLATWKDAKSPALSLRSQGLQAAL